MASPNMTVDTLIIDANNLLHRAHYVSNLTDKSGNRVSGVYGVMRMTTTLMRKFPTKSVIVAWDKGRCQARMKIYPEYKGHRDASRKEEDVKALQMQKIKLQEIFSYLPVKQLAIQDIEADDVIGVLANKLKGSKMIVSNDTDFIQLVKDDTYLYLPNKEKVLSENSVDIHLGFPAKHYVLWKCMVGDSSDNIKGIHGIGEKKATAIILNGVGGGKKLKIKPDEQAILDRNKYLIAIGALLTPEQQAKIKKAYKAERKKTGINFKHVLRMFVQMQFKSLYFDFNQFKYPYEKLIRKAK